MQPLTIALLAPIALVMPRAGMMPHAASPRISARASVAAEPVTSPKFVDEDIPLLSGLQGKAMLVEMEDIPNKGQVKKVWMEVLTLKCMTMFLNCQQ